MTPPSIAEVHAQLTAPGSAFEMEEIEIRGVRQRVWRSCPPNLRAILDISRLHGDKTFLVYEDDRTTFEEHHRQVASFAQALRDRFGVDKGDRVAIAMRNFPEWSVAFWGTVIAGGVAVPLNAWWTGPELEYGLVDSGTKVVVADGERLERLAGHLDAAPLVATVVVRPEGGVPQGALHWDDVVGTGWRDGPVDPPAVAIDPDDDATIFYTSGTTGRPKGALGTHRNVCTNLLNLAFGSARAKLRAPAGVADGADDGQPAQLLSVPLFHATGCHAYLVGNTAAGGKIVMMRKWDPERALDLIERERVTSFGGVPAMVWQVLESPSFATRDLSSVRSIGYGGAPAPPELVRRIEELFPGRVPTNGYGLTETSAAATLNSGVDYLTHPDSVGVPVPVMDAKVVDAEGDELARGEVGELWLKGPNVVKGYWGKPEETATSFTPDGWLRTGDVARIDDEGFVYIVDRAKDMVIRGGENVYCVEVEAALFEHPAVTDCAVIGVPHHVLGEEVGAVVVLKPGASATEDELAAHVAGRLAAFKVPTHWWFRTEALPRNPAGKVLKRELRAEVLPGA